jgi:GGDEF domain-containing protein
MSSPQPVDDDPVSWAKNFIGSTPDVPTTATADDPVAWAKSFTAAQPKTAPAKLDVPATVDDELANLGYTDQARVALLGNMGRENSWKPGIIFNGHYDPKNQAQNRGLMSWQGERLPQLNHYLQKNGGDWTPNENNLRLQTQFMDRELRSNYPDVYDTLKNPDADLPTVSRSLRDYINYVPDAPYNTRDPEYDVTNNRIWAQRALRRGLGTTDVNGLMSQVDDVLSKPTAAQTSDLTPDENDQLDRILGGKGSPAPSPAQTMVGNVPPAAVQNPLPTPQTAVPPAVAQNPVPEAPDTIQAQLASAFSPDSPRSAVLLTKGNDANDYLLSQPEAKRMLRINTPDGILLVNRKKLKMNPTEVNDYVKKNGFAGLLGKVEDVGNNTGPGQTAVTVTDPATGKEIDSSIVSPPNIPAQAKVNAAMYPGAKQDVVSSDQVIQKRVADQTPVQTTPATMPVQGGTPTSPGLTRTQQPQTPALKPQYTEADFTDWAKNQGVPKNIATRKQFEDALSAAGPGNVEVSLKPSDFSPLGELPVTSDEYLPEQRTEDGGYFAPSKGVNTSARGNLNNITAGLYRPAPGMSEEDAFRNGLMNAGASQAGADNLISSLKAAGKPLFANGYTGAPVAISYQNLKEAGVGGLENKGLPQLAEEKKQRVIAPPTDEAIRQQAIQDLTGIGPNTNRTIAGAELTQQQRQPSEDEIQYRMNQIREGLLPQENKSSAYDVAQKVGAGEAGFFGGAGGIVTQAGGLLRPFGLNEPLSNLGAEMQSVLGYRHQGEGPQGVGENVAGFIGESIPQLAEMTFLPGGAMAKFGGMAAAQAAGENKPWDEVAKEALKGIGTGGVFKSAELLEKPLAKLATVAGGSLVLNAATGMPLDQNVQSALVNTAYEFVGTYGPKAMDKVSRFWYGGEPYDLAITPKGVDLLKTDPNRKLTGGETVIDPKNPAYNMPPQGMRQGSFEPPKQPAEVPETPAEPEKTQYTSQLDEIRQNDARTKKQIQALFPDAQLSNEQAADLRRQAWGETNEVQQPPAQQISSENVPATEAQAPPEQVTGTTQEGGTPAAEPNAVAPETPQTVTHPDENINGKPIIAQTQDGRVVVPNENNQSGVSIVKNREPAQPEKGFDITGETGGQPTSAVGKLKEQRDLAQRTAETSPKTGLPNNVAFDKASKRLGDSVAYGAVDMNGTKNVNDTQGHDIGDQALKDAGNSLQSAAKEIDPQAQIFHLQGDEFSVIAKDKDTVQTIIDKADEIHGEKKYGNASTTIAGAAGDSYADADSRAIAAKDERKAAMENPPPERLNRATIAADEKAITERTGAGDNLGESEVSGHQGPAGTEKGGGQTPLESGPPGAGEPTKAEVKKPSERSLPKTLESAQLEKGTNLTYEPETLKNTGLDRGRRVVAEKGLDGAREYVLHGEGIDWAPTGYAVMEAQRNEIAEMRKTDPAKADKLYEQHREFVNQFAEKATEKGQSIVGIKAIEEFAPDRAAYLLNKVSKKVRGRDISQAESDRITQLGTELERERNRSRVLEEQLAKKDIRTKPKPKEKKETYLSSLEKASEEAKASIVARLGKMDFQGVKKAKDFSGQKGAIGEQRELPGDAELLAKYAAGRLHKAESIEALNKELMDISNGEAEPYLPEIRKRAYQIRQEARIKALEDADTSPTQRTSIIQHIRNEIKEANDLTKAQEKEAASKQKALIMEAAKETRKEAREQAKTALTEQRAKDKAIADEARQQARDLRKSLIDAKVAEMKGYRASIKEQRLAAKHAELWDTPIRNMAEEARKRLVNADPKSPDTVTDLASVGAEKFLRSTAGGVPGRQAIYPAQFYREMEAEFPDLVTGKNRNEIYKQAYQQSQDAVNASREAARLRSASAESKKAWNEQGMDIDKQAILIQRARNQRKQTEIRNQMASEFNRVSQGRVKRVAKEVMNLPRGLQTSLNMHLGRQGLFNMLTHPISVTAKGAIPGTLKGFFSGTREDFLQRVKELKEAPGFNLAEESGVNFAELPGVTTNLKGGIEEDELQSSWGQKIPWVRRSTQGFVLGMNTERLLQFNRYAAIADAQGYTPENNPKFFKEIADIVNDATGRGTAPKAIEKAMSLTNQIMYSNRLKVSQIKIINDLFNPWKYSQYDPLTRKIMAGEMVKTVASLTALYGAMIAMGGKAVDDPNDPDFFKVRFGHTHYDLTGGTGATLRFAYRFVKSVGQSMMGEKLAEKDQPLSIAAKFARNKLAPWPSAAIDYLSGKNAIGEPANFEVHPSAPVQTMKENIAARLLTPIVVEDIANGLQDGGYVGGAKTLPVLAGVSEQTYPPYDEKLKSEIADKKAELKNAKSPEELRTVENSLKALKSQQTQAVTKKFDEASPEERKAMLADPAALPHIVRHLQIKRAQNRKAQAQFNTLQQQRQSH